MSRPVTHLEDDNYMFVNLSDEKPTEAKIIAQLQAEGKEHGIVAMYQVHAGLKRTWVVLVKLDEKATPEGWLTGMHILFGDGLHAHICENHAH